MDLKNLEPGIKDNPKETPDEEVEETIDIPLAEESKDEKKGEITSRIITDEEEIKKIEQEKKVTNVMVDASTRTCAAMRLEACENDVTIDAVYNQRLETLMQNTDLDEKGFNLSKHVLDNAFQVAKELGVPDKEDTDTIFLLSQVVEGKFNPRERLQAVRAARKRKPSSTLTEKQKKERRRKNKAARKARKKNRK